MLTVRELTADETELVDRFLPLSGSTSTPLRARRTSSPGTTTSP
jgi:hypothetical protein